MKLIQVWIYFFIEVGEDEQEKGGTTSSLVYLMWAEAESVIR